MQIQDCYAKKPLHSVNLFLFGLRSEYRRVQTAVFAQCLCTCRYIYTPSHHIRSATPVMPKIRSSVANDGDESHGKSSQSYFKSTRLVH